MKKIFYFIIVLLNFGCAVHPHLRSGITFPDVISPIYYLDTFQIRNPVVVYINSVPYITDEAILRDTIDNKPLEERKGVVRYLTRNLSIVKSGVYYDIYKINSKEIRKSYYTQQYENDRLFIEDNLFISDSINGLPVYRFDLKPQNFLLTLVARTEHTIPYIEGWGEEVPFNISPSDKFTLANDVIDGFVFSQDYILALAPLFSKKDQKILLQREIIRSKEDR